ncbi:MAG: class I SAM-dependent methyltransferase [Candidatus Hydrogenedentes bacterium]|nr:class I SAM-dependent methyltransferase [Candidatus Hydrogenedentota bacterium]HNZ16877.1 class I SAM-dependent methyltransferase [Candidatus Hydrogenedentota bacterium]HOH35734.1 class I SAM-dependent methyltransferase [Candidatus Hydrogenedentota bacterium]HPV35679.1 class I SAM-dependent methyltransferase [Candidatus Hydrogenedentota bacterium]HQM30923.1 class I SAM-dependent methyltransferase [Candidatus Hydrogenedentota bacterium]
MSESPYELWADYYDIVHTGLPGEAEFYVGQAVRTRAETLELGCGTGRIAIPMAMSGVNVVGLDNSKAMLRQCREKKRRIGPTPGRLRLVEGDMSDFDLGQVFDLAVMPYRAFMHLLTPESRASCLACVYRHLRPGGLFILNVWVPRERDLAAHRARERGTIVFAGRYPLAGTQRELAHSVAAWCDEERQILEEQHQLQEVDRRGEVTYSAILPMQRAWLTPVQMRRLLETQHFAVDAVFGDFECAPYTAESTEMIWVASRPATGPLG